MLRQEPHCRAAFHSRSAIRRSGESRARCVRRGQVAIIQSKASKLHAVIINDLRWPPVRARISFKVLLVVYKSLTIWHHPISTDIVLSLQRESSTVCAVEDSLKLATVTLFHLELLGDRRCGTNCHWLSGSCLPLNTTVSVQASL